MFGIDFSEFFIIALVALIVIGPERLPKVARTLGHLFGRMQRYVSEIKSEIDREVKLDEVRKLQEQFREAAKSAQHTFTDEVVKTEHMIKAIPETEEPTVKPEPSAAPEPQSTEHLADNKDAEEPAPQLELGFERQSEPSTNPPKQA